MTMSKLETDPIKASEGLYPITPEEPRYTRMIIKRQLS